MSYVIVGLCRICGEDTHGPDICEDCENEDKMTDEQEEAFAKLFESWYNKGVL